MRFRHASTGAVFVACAAMIAGCSSDNNPGSPTPNPPPALTVKSVAVTSAPRSAGTFQISARAEMSDGSQRDVTTDAQWSTSNPDIATISSGGLLTVVRSGQVDVRATYQNVTGIMAMTVTAPPPPPSQLIIFSGTTTEAPPAAKPLGEVTIRITEGPAAGLSIVSDSEGRWGFTQFPSGRLSLEAEKGGYVTYRLNGLMLDHDHELEIVMFPTPPADSSGATATARCNDGSWSWAQTRAAACTANGGVAYTVCPGPLCTTQTSR